MKLLSLALALFVSCSIVSADTINGRLTVTNAMNINPTNAYTVTVNSDTRTLTNAVVTPATQILVTTNSVAAMVQRLRVHFSTYKVTGLSLSSDNSTYIQWRAPSGTALTVALNTNTWAVVSYTTNTTESGTAVRVPFSIEDSDTQDRVSDGLMAWLNEAPTNKLSSSKVTWAHSALGVDSAATNFVADFGGNPYRTITATNNIFFIQSTNRPTAATNALALWIIIDPNGTNRTLGFNSSWSFVGVKPTSLVSTNLGLLKLIVNGTGETNVIAEYRDEYELPGVQSINGDSTAAHTIAAGTSGSDVAVSTAGGTTTINIPTASGANRGALSTTDFTTFSNKAPSSRALTIAGTANEITSSAGAQDLSVDRTWTLSLPSAVTLTGKTLTGGTHVTPLIDDYLEMNEESAPTTPASGKGRLYFKSDGKIYSKDDAGNEYDLTDTAAPGSGDDVYINGSDITNPDFDDSLDIALTISAVTNVTPSFARTATLGGNPALSANHVTVGTTGLIAEGASADNIETLLDFEDPTGSDKTFTIPAATDTAVGKATTDVFTNKTLDAAGTGNVLKQTKYLTFIRPDYGDGAGAVPQTNTYTASGLMHYTFSGSAETNANWVVYEAMVPPDIDTSVAMTATFAFVSGGTDADDVTFHLTYALGAAGTALPTGTGISTSPIVATVTPTTPASGDVQTTAATTLTGWAGSMTAGTPLFIRVARLNNSNDDTARDLYLRVAYGSTQ